MAAFGQPLESQLMQYMDFFSNSSEREDFSNFIFEYFNFSR